MLYLGEQAQMRNAAIDELAREWWDQDIMIQRTTFLKFTHLDWVLPSKCSMTKYFNNVMDYYFIT